MDYFKESLKLHEKLQGKIDFASKAELNTKDDLSLAYSPGVAEPCKEIAKKPDLAYKYTIKGNTVAVISDGSAVLGLGNIGGLAGLPVMEGKCALFKRFAGVNAFPIVLDTQDTEEIIATIKHISPTIGGINLEDISSPRCFEIEERLKEELNIPVFHDDQHGTAIVCLAGLINGLKITGKKKEEIKVVINGVGAAGIAIAKLFLKYGIKDIIAVDSKGIIYKGRENLNTEKEILAEITNKNLEKGVLADAVKGRDVFVGVSVAGALTSEMVKSMSSDPMIFAMANPIPEIMPDEAKKAGARIIATGRSDFPNQLNNVLVFPGIFKGALQNRVTKITDEMKIKAAEGLAAFVENPTPEKIIPSPFEDGIADAIARVVK
ncbi:NAD-dependent malic enzyme [Candidatus Gracilibacteria bacterium GN02-872]|nr:NAD-dependent malic enzyme [Candidatus Gracilibacteria bacterium GN02-872]